MQDKNTCCNQECNQDRACPVRAGTHKPAEAVHQIQEPAVNQQLTTEQEPVWGQSRFHGQQWMSCAAEHVTMVLADPRYAEEGYEARYLYAAPVLAAQPSDKDLLDVLGDEIDSSDETFIGFGRAVLAKFGRLNQAAPAVVAVPDERAAFEAHIKARPNYFDGMLANGKYANCFKVIDIDNQWIGWKARAALAATPATTDEPPFLQRLRTEQHDLSERHQKISVFIVSPAFQMLTDDDKGLLRKQEAQQHVLLQTLNQRIHSASEKHMREKNNG